MGRIYGAGETVLDLIFDGKSEPVARPGGSVLNALISLGRLGTRPVFISEYGTDPAGLFIDRFLQENGVQTGYCYRYPDGKTSLALAWLDAQRNASYSFYHDLPDRRLQIEFPDFQAGDFLLFGSFFAISPALRPVVLPLIRKAREKGAFILYDPNFRSAHAAERGSLLPLVRENLGYASLVRGSDEDFRSLFDTGDPESAYREVSPACPILVYTRGGGEITVMGPAGRTDFRLPPIRPVSTIGAGDNFNAGILYAMLRMELNAEKLKEAGKQVWTELVETATAFSADVCGSYDNYISPALVKKLRQGEGPGE